jgi:hypothetical protein
MRGGRVLAAKTSVEPVELAQNGCRTVEFRFWVTGKLAGPGRYVLWLRARDAEGASNAMTASHRTRR